MVRGEKEATNPVLTGFLFFEVKMREWYETMALRDTIQVNLIEDGDDFTIEIQSPVGRIVGTWLCPTNFRDNAINLADDLSTLFKHLGFTVVSGELKCHPLQS